MTDILRLNLSKKEINLWYCNVNLQSAQTGGQLNRQAGKPTDKQIEKLSDPQARR
jgi:hypothetical protein